MKVKFILFIGVILLLSSCASKKKIIYLQGDDPSFTNVINYEPKIQPDDLLFINISSESNEASEPFNLNSGVGQNAGGINIQFNSYLVDKRGTIQLPVIGLIKVDGLTKTEFHDLLKIKLSEHLKDPILNVRIVNFKITVMGEVRRPGPVTLNSDRITVFEALAQAGDLTIAGDRQNVLLVRDESGIKSFYRLDLTDSNLVNSPYYYLKQNDLVLVEPRFTTPQSSAIGANLSIAISLISFLITITLLVTR